MRDRSQDRIVGKKVPLGHDVRWRLKRISQLVVIGMSEEIREIENEIGEDSEEQDQEEKILRSVVWVKRYGVTRAFHVEARRIVVARHVQRPDMHTTMPAMMNGSR